jgi:serine/threonine protein kinase
LLDAYAGADTFLEVPVETTDAFDLAFGESEGVGSVVGAYDLVEEIGRGGMGQVFREMQSSPIRRQVALKTIRIGLDSRENIKRFEAERQAMAQMNHHGVAKLLDAGGTSTGRPWFVMELTVGQSITTYCQQNSLPLVDRLHLFESVCEAIQHAHENGVIHCDIKPDNVVVTIVNGKPFCKVIDFGVAILLDRETNASSVKTAGVPAEANELPATIVGTFSYISPEQTVLSDHELDARCDVYSLGMLDDPRLGSN